MNIYIDIETIPTQRADVFARIREEGVKVPANYKDPAKIEKYRLDHLDDEVRKTALDGSFGELCVVCYAIDDGPVVTHTRLPEETDDRGILSGLWFGLQQLIDRRPAQQPTFAGHNVAFDLRFLHHRSVVHALQPPLWLPYNAAPWQGRMIDTMYEWCGARGSIKLTRLCEALGIDVEDSIDGAGVWDAWQSGDHETVVEHCRADVERVRHIVNRINFR